MIGIKTQDGFLDLMSADAGFELVSPFFDDDLGIVSGSFKFAVPGTVKNARILKYQNLILNDDAPEIEAEVWLAGSPWRAGTLHVLGAVDNGPYSVAFQIEKGNVRRELEELRLRTLDWPEENWVGGQLIAQFELNYTSDPVEIRVSGKTFFTTAASRTDQEMIEDLRDQVNAANVNCVASAAFSGAWSISLVGDDPFRPFFADELGANWTVVQNNASAGQYVSSIQTHMDAVAGGAIGDYDYAFPMIWNPSYYPESTSSFSGFLNSYDLSGNTYLMNSDTAGEEYRTAYVPCLWVPAILRKILEALGLVDANQWIDSEPSLQFLYIYQNKGLDAEAEGVNWGIGGIRIGEHIPGETTAWDIFEAVLTMFNMRFSVAGSDIYFYQRNELISQTGERDWRSYCAQGYQQREIQSPAQGFGYKEDRTDALFEEGYSFEDIGPNDATKTTRYVAPIFERDYLPIDDTGVKKIKAPTIQQASANSILESEPEEHGFRWMFYHGLQKRFQAGSEEYPEASHTGVTRTGDDLTKLSLEWTGSRGLYTQRHERFQVLANVRKEVEVSVLLPVHELLSLNWNAPYRIRARETEYTAFLRKVNFSAQANGRFPVLATATLIPAQLWKYPPT